MPQYKVFYRYEEYGRGKATIEARDLEEAKRKFEEGDFTHDEEEIEDSDSSIKGILNLDSDKWEMSELGEIDEFLEEQSQGIDSSFDEDE